MSLVGEGVNGEGRAWAKERAGIKERWREINTALTELRDAQCTWTIPDPALKANMKDAVGEDFLPVYKVGLSWGTFGSAPIKRSSCLFHGGQFSLLLPQASNPPVHLW